MALSSLRARLVLLVLVAALPALALVLYMALWQERQEQIAIVERDALQLARVAAGTQRRLVGQAQQLLVGLSRLAEVRRGDGPACSVVFADVLARHPLYTNLAAARDTGEVFCSALPLARPVNLADRAWFQRGLAPGSFSIGTFRHGVFTGKNGLAIAHSRPVVAGADAARVVLITGIDFSWVDRFVAEARLPAGSAVAVVDAQGTILAGAPASTTRVGQSVRETALSPARWNGRVEGTFSGVDVDGVDRLWAFARLAPESGSSLFVGLPARAAFARADWLLVRNLLALAVVTTLALAAAWVVGDATVLRRVRAQLGRGDRLETERKALAEVGRELATTSDLAQVMDRIVTIVLQVLRARSAALWQIEEASGALVCLATAGDVPEGEWIGRVLPSGAGIAGRAVLAGGPMRTSSVLEEPGLSLPDWIREHIRARKYGALAAAPLRVRGEVIGALALGDDAGRVFADDELQLLDAFADMAAVAIQNARLYQGEKVRALRLSTLTRLNQVVSSSLDLEETLVAIATAASELTETASVTVWTADAAGGIVRRPPAFAAMYPGESFRFGEGIVGWVAMHRRTANIPDVSVDPRTRAPDLLRACGLRSVLAIPILADDSLLGVLTLAGPRPFELGSDTQNLLDSLVAQAAAAIGNARLYEQTQQQRRDAEALATLNRTLAETLDPDVIGRRTAETARLLLDARHAGVYRLNRETGSLVATAFSGDGSTSWWFRDIPDGTGVGGLAVRERRAVTTPDFLDDPRVVIPPENRAALAAAEDRALLSVPLLADYEVIGTLTVSRARGREFGPREVSLAEALAASAALALENALLYAAAEQRRDEAETLATLVRAISATLDLDAVLQQVVEAARRLSGSDLAEIALRDPESDSMVVRYGAGAARSSTFTGLRVERGKGIGGLAWARGRPVRTSDRLGDPALSRDYDAAAREEGIVTSLAVPVVIAGRVEGLLYANNRSARPFGDRDEAVITWLAGHAAIAIQNARLFRGVQGTSERLTALSRRLLEVQETERRHLARELHDEIGQALTAIKLNLESLGRAVQAPGVARRIGDSMEIVDGALDRVRNLSSSLRPSILDDLGLADAVRWYVRREARRAGLGADIVVEPLEPRPAPEIETACFRILQEAMTNVVRHARARRVGVRLVPCECRAHLELTVSDDGVGFDVAPGRVRAVLGGSLGLLGMEERVTLVGGRLRIQSAPGHGTAVDVRLPVVLGARA